MQENDRIYFMQQLNLIAQLYNKKFTPELYNLYWEELINYEWADVRQAMRLCTQKGKYMPKVADIMEQLQHLGIAGKPKTSISECAFEYQGERCPLTATQETLCTYHAHFRDHEDPSIHVTIFYLIFRMTDKLLQPFRERDTHLFLKRCKQIKAFHEEYKRVKIDKQQEHVIERIEPSTKEDERLRAVKNVLIKQNSPWAMELRQ